MVLSHERAVLHNLEPLARGDVHAHLLLALARHQAVPQDLRPLEQGAPHRARPALREDEGVLADPALVVLRPPCRRVRERTVTEMCQTGAALAGCVKVLESTQAPGMSMSSDLSSELFI